ncbi:hypothetical protein ACWEQG_01680 [Microbispora sp. NPDC004025]
MTWTLRQGPEQQWVADERSAPGIYLEHLDGVAWTEAPLPRRWHRCRPQTRALDRGMRVFRCPCGAIALDEPSGWVDRNSGRRWWSL